ncbi:sensor histidine kinase [Hydrogenophaga pseudoflava]|uniref:sensor histidine kinase n=1 Tax=Hydrogenophaga pseudoflava TaxID=47421 RepID=UPI0027E49843|nr:ATP-binding protein [Hydrogenophaga pseudoflava]MDQ7745164.1 ATP-binding protein [Hydrogenophaga pseudoflava]
MIARDTASYERQLSAFRLAYSKAGSITSIGLVLAGVGLDYFSYPERLTEFFLLRLLVASLTLGILMLLYTRMGAEQVRVLTMSWLVLPQVMIAWMIWLTSGVDSIYFVGLHLAMYAVGIILPITLFEGIGFGVLTLVLYMMACMLHPDGVAEPGKLYTNSLFILFSAIASAVCTWFNERARLRLFELQHEVAMNNDKLQETNRTLAEVKGQLIQREKMAAIGTLSAGLLHELNNPVNYALMAVNMGLSVPSAKTDPMLKESLEDAREGLTRVQNIVSDLKTFAYQKPGDDSQRPFLLEHAVRSAIRLAGYELKGIELALDLPQDTHVVGDEPAIIGVLINLLSNAAHALQSVQRAAPRIDVRVAPVGERLQISVRDNGHGIDPANIGRVFEPFFTTRDVGAGLGLGLSVSYGIVQRHGGILSVDSVFGEWTEFSFDLPRPVQ